MVCSCVFVGIVRFCLFVVDDDVCMLFSLIVSLVLGF